MVTKFFLTMLSSECSVGFIFVFSVVTDVISSRVDVCRGGLAVGRVGNLDSFVLRRFILVEDYSII